MIDIDEMKSPDLSVYISSSSSEFLIILIHNKIIKAVYSTDFTPWERQHNRLIFDMILYWKSIDITPMDPLSPNKIVKLPSFLKYCWKWC